jgi:CheY-like chemotaxis protein
MSAARILVVDDDSITRELVRGVLERAGHEVREAPDGRAGLRELFAASPDLVILDVGMPELDGWATLERVRDLSDVPGAPAPRRRARRRAEDLRRLGH